MRIFTERRILVNLVNVPFTWGAFNLLDRLSRDAPNLRLEAVEEHSGKAIPVRLCTLDFDWGKTNSVNLPNS